MLVLVQLLDRMVALALLVLLFNVLLCFFVLALPKAIFLVSFFFRQKEWTSCWMCTEMRSCRWVCISALVAVAIQAQRRFYTKHEVFYAGMCRDEKLLVGSLSLL